MPKHVLYLHANSQLGGSQISILTLMRYLDPDRYLSEILLGAAGPFLDLARSFGVNVGIQDFSWFSKRHPWIYVRSLYRLVRTIKTDHIDLVHMNCVHSLLYGSRVCRLLRIPYVFHVRDARQPWFEPNALMTLNQSQGVIANSAFISRICHEKGVSPALTKTVYNPIEIEKFSKANNEVSLKLRSSLQIPPEAFVFGFVGRLHVIKGPDLFIRAAVKVLKHLPNAHFIIAGEAREQAYARELRSLLSSEDLVSKVHFLGFYLDIPSVMKSLDVLVVPSRDEPFGRVVVEAMACGCPVTVSRIGGLVEIVTDGWDGLIVLPNNVEALATAMIRLAQNPEFRSHLAENGQQTACKFTPERHANEIQSIYDEILRN